MFQIKGLDKLEEKLKNMDRKVGKSIVRKSVRKAQNICLKEAKQNASSLIGGDMGSKIDSALKVKAVNKQKKGMYQLQVCIDPAKADEFKHKTEAGTEYFIPTAIEYGHRNRDGGTTAPVPFMRTAADSTEKQRAETVINEIKKGIDNA